MRPLFMQISFGTHDPLRHVAETMPELGIIACVRRRAKSPYTDFRWLCEAMNLVDEAVLAGLMDAHTEDDEEEEAYDEGEAYDEEERKRKTRHTREE